MIVRYKEKIREWIQPFFSEKPVEEPSERCCISVFPDKIALINLNKTPQAIELRFAETLQYDNPQSLALILSGLVQKNELQIMPTKWLLSPEEYQLFLIESLPVSKEEFKDALNWRIRSLINYPIEEATTDYFQLPAKKGANENPMIALVAARSESLEMNTSIFRKSKLRLSEITIPELAMRNLSALYEDDEKSTAFIYFYEHIAILNITREKTLYFTRHLNVTLLEESHKKDYEQISLEILRYFDYFQSQWRFPNPGRIFVASEREDPEEIAKLLSDYFLLTVKPYTLPPILSNVTDYTTLNKEYLLMLGCLLNKEKMDAPPGN